MSVEKLLRPFERPEDLVIDGMRVGDMDRDELIVVMWSQYQSTLRVHDEMRSVIDEYEAMIAELRKHLE